jgi:hypothetical protein
MRRLQIFHLNDIGRTSMVRQLFDLRHSWTLFVLSAVCAVAPAQAHFLWIMADAGSKSSHLTFGETPDEATPDGLVARLADARVRDGAGKAVALTQGEGGWTGPVPTQATLAAVQSWGVVDRSGDGTGAFLLEYYAKGGAGLPDTATDLKLPLELFARREAGQIVATLRRGGQAVAGSPFKISLPSGRSLDRTSDAQGEVRFDGEGGGLYGVRARWLEDRKGESGGKAYGEVRHYATLTFALPDATAAGSEPTSATTEPAATAAKPQQADPAAYALLKKAHDSRQVMPADFPGFRSELVFQQGDQVWRGELIYRRQGETEVRLQGADEASLGWARGQILNLVGHRRGGDFAKGDGRHPLQLGPDDGNPYGRLIVLNDGLQSSYRVRDNKVTEVTRTSEGSRFTISVLEAMDADDGKYLANHFLVTYRDAATGALQKFEGYRDGYSRIHGIWLPTSRTVIEVSDKSSPVVRTLRLRKIEPLDAAAAKTAQGAPAPGTTP